jgi:RND family efflux transporter MFP subunit
VEVTGSVRPELDASIASKVMGRVQSVLVREGDRVHRGEPLVVLDARDLDASISQASAGLHAAAVGYDTARTTARMESALSQARIAEAQSKVAQSEAALQAARARQDLVQAGPRRQEREQAVLAVSQADAGYTLAEHNLKRMASLFDQGAISAQQYDQYHSQFEIVKSQLAAAQQARSMVEEGSRTEEIRAADQAVREAQAGVQEAHAALKSAQAGALQTEVRRQEVQGARAQIGQSRAGLLLAQMTRNEATIPAPFDGVVTKRLADPGTMAAPGVPLLAVQGGALRLEASAPESVLAFVRRGSTVPMYFDALQNHALTGRVVEIAPQGDESSHTFTVKIDLPAGCGALPGMFGRARFITGMEKRILVPSSAMREREGLHYLYVVDDSHIARMRMVTVGEPVGDRIPILSGLNPGEQIVSKGVDRLADGSLVTGGQR